MHELSLCQGLIGQVTRVATSEGADAVSRVTLRLGPLAGVEPRLLKEAFSIARAGTIAADAELVVEAQSLQVRCLECQERTEASPNDLTCAHCRSWRTQVLSGDEMLLARVELVFK